MLKYLYDVKVSASEIEFVVVGMSLIAYGYEEIAAVQEVGKFSIGKLSAYNFKNRFASRTFMLEFFDNPFSKYVLITPENPQQFISFLRAHSVKLTLL